MPPKRNLIPLSSLALVTLISSTDSFAGWEWSEVSTLPLDSALQINQIKPDLPGSFYVSGISGAKPYALFTMRYPDTWYAPIFIGPTYSSHPVFYSNQKGTSAMLWVFYPNNGIGPQVIQASIQSNGLWTSPVTLGAVCDNNQASIIVDSKGNAMAVWSGYNGIFQYAIFREGVWSSAISFVESKFNACESAISPLAIDSKDKIYFTFLTESINTLSYSGTSWSPASELSNSSRPPLDLVNIVDESDRLTVAWSSESISGARTIESTQNINGRWVNFVSTAAPDIGSNLDIGLDPQGNPLITWLNYTSDKNTSVGAAGLTSGNWTPLPSLDMGSSVPSQNIATNITKSGTVVAVWKISGKYKEGYKTASLSPSGWSNIETHQLPLIDSSIYQGTTAPSIGSNSKGDVLILWSTLSRETNLSKVNYDLNYLLGHDNSPPPIRSYVLDVTLSGQGSVASSPSGISCGKTCSSSFMGGSNLNLTPTPMTGYYFSGWGGDCTGSALCNIQMNANKAVSATFLPIKGGATPPTPTPTPIPTQGYKLQVVKSAKGNITSNPKGINCGLGSSVCSARFPSNSTVTLTATPKTGYKVNGWVGCSSTTGATCTAVIGRNPTRVSATYAKS